jgi:hypothetical protein
LTDEAPHIPKRRALHDAIQDLLHEDGLVLNWVCIAEVTDGSTRQVAQYAGGGSDGLEQPTEWSRIGMCETVLAVLKDAVLGMYVGSGDDEEFFDED